MDEIMPINGDVRDFVSRPLLSLGGFGFNSIEITKSGEKEPRRKTLSTGK